MEYGPDQVLRMVQLGEKEVLLASHDIWLCASCETCGTRCPNEIDIARVMDALREMAVAEGSPIAEPDALKFHRLFLLIVQNMGRMHEATLFGGYKLWTLHLLEDMDSGARMIAKGKVPLLPELVRARKEIKEIFTKSR
jgi:heterodisulfide reductase subunit C